MFQSVIIIIGMPRSGTSWLSQIFDSSPQVRFRLSPLYSYEFKNYVDEKSPKEDWDYLFSKAYLSENEFMSQTVRRESGQYPNFNHKDPNPEYLVIKDTRFHNLVERMLELFNNLKMVAIVRHPCGAINSWLKAPREFPRNADPMKEWRAGVCRKTGWGEFWGFDDWKSVTRLHMRMERKMPDRFFIQRYEDLVKHPLDETRKLFHFFGIRYTKYTENFLFQCHAKHVENEYAVFKNPNVVDNWQKDLSMEIQKEIIEEIKVTDLKRFIL